MTRSRPTPLTFRFGAFTLSPGEGELRRNGVSIRLAPQPFQLLSLLVERAGHLVTREEMQQAIWGEHTVVDSELGLNRCIRRVREVLLDDADTPRYIETLPRTGYRFIAPVEVLPGGPAPAAPPESRSPAVPVLQGGSPAAVSPAGTPAASSHRPGGAYLWWGAGLAAMVIFGIAAVVWFQSGYRSRVGSDFSMTPLVSYIGIEYAPAFSPDGRQVAFVWNGEKQDNFDIYVKPIDSPKALRLTSNADIDFSPAWSPDGGSIAFCRGTHTAKRGAIWTISPLGGPERKIASLRTGILPEHRQLTWSPDGKWLAYVDVPDAPQREGALFLWNVQTQESRQISFPGPNEVDYYPAFAPDGRTIAFVRDTGRGISGIRLLPLGADPSARVTPVPLAWKGFEQSYCLHPAWTPDSREIVFASNRGSERRLWIAPANGSAQPRMLAELGLDVTDAAISSGGEMAFTHETSNINIWKLHLPDVKRGNSPAPVRVIASTRQELAPRVSPDGRRIAFSSSRSGYMEIWVSNPDGSDAIPLTSLHSLISGSPSWSSDARRIAFDSRTGRKPTIYVMPSEGGKPVALTDDSSQNVLPAWSPDDKWIYFTSDRSGRVEIWRMPPSGGAPQQVTFRGGTAPRTSPDGNFLYYLRDRQVITSLHRLNLRTGEEEYIAPVLKRAFSPTADGVYYFSGLPDGGPSLRLFDLHTRASRELLRLERPVDFGMTVSPDQQDLFYTQIDQASSDLMLVDRFWK